MTDVDSGSYGTVIASVPTTLEYVAAITVVPEPTPVTTPVLETAAAAVLDDVHDARLVTSCVLPVDMVAVAVNWDVAPTVGVAPVTVIAVMELAAVDEFPHAAASAASANTRISAVADRVCMQILPDGAGIVLMPS